MNFEEIFSGYKLAILLASPIILVCGVGIILMLRIKQQNIKAIKISIASLVLIILKSLIHPLTRNLVWEFAHNFPQENKIAYVNNMSKALLWHDLSWLCISIIIYSAFIYAIILAVSPRTA